MKNNRNYYIDFLKFIFSIIIICYHSWIFNENFGRGYFNSGYLAVDFYFIVTGYLFIKSVEKIQNDNSNEENWGKLALIYIKNKIKKVFPFLLVTSILGYLLIYMNNITDYKLLFSNTIISELTLSGFLGYGMTINSACWYISVMIIVLFILFPIAYKYKKNYNFYIAPLIIIASLGITKYNNININDPLSHNFIFINGFYKGLIFINLGIISYEIANYLKNIKIRRAKRIKFTILETLIYIFLILNMHFSFAGTFITAILFTINTAITFSNLSLTSEVFKFKFIEKIGIFGFLMYLSNIPVRSYLISKYHSTYNYTLIILFGLSILMALVTSIIIYIINKILDYRLKKHSKIINSQE